MSLVQWDLCAKIPNELLCFSTVIVTELGKEHGAINLEALAFYAIQLAIDPFGIFIIVVALDRVFGVLAELTCERFDLKEELAAVSEFAIRLTGQFRYLCAKGSCKWFVEFLDA